MRYDTEFNPLTHTVAVQLQYSYKHPVPEQVKPSFVILTSGHSALSVVDISSCTKDHCEIRTTRSRSLDSGVKYRGIKFCYFYRAMHFSAKRGIAIACRLSVRPSVCPSVNCDHIGWNSSKIISRLVSLGRSLFANLT